MRLKCRNFNAPATWALPLVAAAVAITTLAQTGTITDIQVQPILEKKCFQCHGENLKMASLDLRSRESILKGGNTGPALVPGHAEESLIYKRVTGEMTPKMPMAPVPALTSSEQALLKNWIDHGAKWDAPAPVITTAPGDKPNASYAEYKERVITDEMRHWWAFQKPVRHTPPPVSPERWSKNPIDIFVKAAIDLERQTLTRVLVGDREPLQRLARRRAIVDEVPSPNVVAMLGTTTHAAVAAVAQTPLFALLARHFQPLLPPQSVHPLAVDPPAFPS